MKTGKKSRKYRAGQKSKKDTFIKHVSSNLGPIEMDDRIKIVKHGFDLKTSFRKR